MNEYNHNFSHFEQFDVNAEENERRIYAAS